jgi:hypothetical protein
MTDIKYAKAQGWIGVAQFGHARGWLSITMEPKSLRLRSGFSGRHGLHFDRKRR